MHIISHWFLHVDVTCFCAGSPQLVSVPSRHVSGQSPSAGLTSAHRLHFRPAHIYCFLTVSSHLGFRPFANSCYHASLPFYILQCHNDCFPTGSSRLVSKRLSHAYCLSVHFSRWNPPGLSGHVLRKVILHSLHSAAPTWDPRSVASPYLAPMRLLCCQRK